MLRDFINRNAKYLMIVMMVFITYIAYLFSFRNASDAVRLNSQLEAEKRGGQSLPGSYGQLEKRHQFYLTALKAYQVKIEDRENRLWQALSGIAVSKGLAISFVPKTQVVIDTTDIQKGLVADQFTFKGKYFNMVKLLDSIHKTKGIGRLSEFKLSKKKMDGANAESDQLTMQLSIAALATKN